MIQYFQDRTEYGSYDPLFPGYRTDIWIVRSTISRIELSMDRTIHYFQDRTDIWIVQSNISRIIGKLENWTFQIVSFFSKIRDPGCRRSIRLVKTVCLNQFSDFIIVKNGPKSTFNIRFAEKSSKSPNCNNLR